MSCPGSILILIHQPNSSRRRSNPSISTEHQEGEQRRYCPFHLLLFEKNSCHMMKYSLRVLSANLFCNVRGMYTYLYNTFERGFYSVAPTHERSTTQFEDCTRAHTNEKNIHVLLDLKDTPGRLRLLENHTSYTLSIQQRGMR